jgi:hypothetical protein
VRELSEIAMTGAAWITEYELHYIVNRVLRPRKRDGRKQQSNIVKTRTIIVDWFRK